VTIAKKHIEAQLVEQQCTACNKGVYRKALDVIYTKPTPQYEHKCSNPECDSEPAYFTVIYPMVEYKGKMFMLADSIRFNEPSSNTSY